MDPRARRDARSALDPPAASVAKRPLQNDQNIFKIFARAAARRALDPPAASVAREAPPEALPVAYEALSVAFPWAGASCSASRGVFPPWRLRETLSLPHFRRMPAASQSYGGGAPVGRSANTGPLVFSVA